jgi:hypothetical protein
MLLGKKACTAADRMFFIMFPFHSAAKAVGVRQMKAGNLLKSPNHFISKRPAAEAAVANANALLVCARKYDANS